MRTSVRLSLWCLRGVVLSTVFALACGPAAQPSPTSPPAPPAATTPAKPAEAKPTEAKPAAKVESLDELYQRARGEGGKLVFYGTLAQVNAEKLFPVWRQRFPGIEVEHVDATGDKLVARAVSEARGGKTFADVFASDLQYVAQVNSQQLLRDVSAPESQVYPETLRGSYWTATDFVIMLGAWNTNLVPKGEEPKGWEDLADPKWKGKLIGEPRDVEVLIGLARYKYKDDNKAVDLLKRIAANNPEFHDGHSELAELLVAGQGAACFTCYSHHYPPRISKGAPVGYWLTEGVAQINAVAVMKDAPHPNTALLFYRWLISEEGQKAMAQAGRTPAHPRVEPLEKTRPEQIYPMRVEDLQDYPRYQQIWKEIFGLR